ncbi:MAG: hypothetical protein P1U34_00290 [Coxiellaceae bacterium]|nr:hypothetical protein [Coxiellaceae bacterium]
MSKLTFIAVLASTGFGYAKFSCQNPSSDTNICTYFSFIITGVLALWLTSACCELRHIKQQINQLPKDLSRQLQV